MTRSDFSLALIVAAFTQFALMQNALALTALVAAVFAHVTLALTPIMFQSNDELLRKEFADALAEIRKEHRALDEKVQMLVLGRAR